MTDSEAWRFAVGGWTYLWPRGQLVQVFDSVAYTRRLAGETLDARPFKAEFVPGGGFESIEDFEDWCRKDRNRR
ncbi:hypothetical protein [Saccharopolyspora hattusasensis]|uniref:hypothetical protein n=1 Tax=Saccharopolyspora hattusasensis TaxID=1128679 RepID=UPI003D979A4E